MRVERKKRAQRALFSLGGTLLTAITPTNVLASLRAVGASPWQYSSLAQALYSRSHCRFLTAWLRATDNKP